MIKIEVNTPEWHLSTESHVLSLYGYNFCHPNVKRGNALREIIYQEYLKKNLKDWQSR